MKKDKANPPIPCSGYVVYIRENLRDGVNESARCFRRLEEALEYMSRDYFCEHNYHFRLFELGKEILLESEKTEVSQPAKVTTRMKVKER